MAWVYIIKTTSGKYYVGSTRDIEKRIEQHDRKQTFTTKRLGVQDVVLTQEYPIIQQARSVERQIKNLKRRDYIDKMVKDGYIKLLPR
jgi:putative endonuclease